MLFSEPKIPQSLIAVEELESATVSVLFSEPKIPQSRCDSPNRHPRRAFQCSSASRKFLNCTECRKRTSIAGVVSVLFSEPKIPQWRVRRSSQRKEKAFQCSSASRKFLNDRRITFALLGCERFSALQRAENSSIASSRLPARRTRVFQCSSASRKFLNTPTSPICSANAARFQCSSASRKFLN